MPERSREAKLRMLANDVATISDAQLEWLEKVVAQFRIIPTVTRNPDSNLVSECIANGFANALQIHHCLSNEPLSKDRFEYALERVFNKCGVEALLAGKNNPGHDISIAGVPFSLKTQADKGIKPDLLHISKFMELGKGAWVVEEDLKGLRERFFVHMQSYDRILQLRRLINSPGLQRYELVEVPKDLLAKAQGAECKFVENSRQNPKPGRCEVRDADGSRLFSLYFDGGTERKLQIEALDKRRCIVHCTWDILRSVAKAEGSGEVPLAAAEQ